MIKTMLNSRKDSVKFKLSRDCPCGTLRLDAGLLGCVKIVLRTQRSWELC